MVDDNKAQSEIRFIKPCRPEWLSSYELTPEYCAVMQRQGAMVQINLDNCTIQRMEELPEGATHNDAERVGLLPLVKLLNAAPVAITAVGVNEMPDKWVAGARTAFQRFCAQFWPGHNDDVEATERTYDASSKAKKVQFRQLNDGQRVTYGCAYVSLLQIQNIRASYGELTPEKMLEAHIHSIVHLLDLVSAFELEIAKYAYWALDNKEIAALPKRLRQRRSDIKENFHKKQSTLAKCQEFAFNGAMDLHWLSGSNLAEDIGVDIKVKGRRYAIDSWVGTNDHKLYRISQDIHSVFFEGSTQKRLAVSRGRVMSSSDYWRSVDSLSDRVLLHRKSVAMSEELDLLGKIDAAVDHIEKSLSRAL